MACSPPCAACTGICNLPVQAAPRSNNKNKHPYPNRNLVMLTCGCREIPFPLISVLGEHIDRVMCDVHGWQEIMPEPKPKKSRKKEIDGQEEMIPF